MIRVVLDQWSWSGSSQRKAPLLAEKFHARLHSSDNINRIKSVYIQTLLYGHLIIMDSLICLVPGERKPLNFLYKIQPA